MYGPSFDSFENEGSSGNLTKKQRRKGKEIAPGNLSFSFVCAL